MVDHTRAPVAEYHIDINPVMTNAKSIRRIGKNDGLSSREFIKLRIEGGIFS
jgi:hypothetical protein